MAAVVGSSQPGSAEVPEPTLPHAAAQRPSPSRPARACLLCGKQTGGVASPKHQRVCSAHGKEKGQREGAAGCQVASEWRRGPLGPALPREGLREPGLCRRLEAGAWAPLGAAVTLLTWILGVTGAPSGGRPGCPSLEMLEGYSC